MEDSSLDEFLESDGEGEREEGESDFEDPSSEPGDGVAEEEREAVREESVEPAASTAQWTPSGAFCERCETETSRLWMDDDAIVCRDCKNW